MHASLEIGCSRLARRVPRYTSATVGWGKTSLALRLRLYLNKDLLARSNRRSAQNKIEATVHRTWPINAWTFPSRYGADYPAEGRRRARASLGAGRGPGGRLVSGFQPCKQVQEPTHKRGSGGAGGSAGGLAVGTAGAARAVRCCKRKRSAYLRKPDRSRGNRLGRPGHPAAEIVSFDCLVSRARS